MNEKETNYLGRTEKLPKPYRLVEISELGGVITGLTPDTDDEENFGGETSFVTPSDLRGSVIIKNTERTITEKGRKDSRIVSKGSIMMDCIGSDMGKVGLSGEELMTNQQINTIDIEKGNNNFYIYYTLERNSNYIKSIAGTTATPILNKGDFSNLKIPIAPLDEQRRIASVLYSVDEQIRTLTDRHGSLTQLKHGLMRDLLTGQKRLFDGDTVELKKVSGNGSEITSDDIPSDWELKPLGEVCEVNSSISDNSDRVEYIPMDALSEELPWPDYTQERNPNENSGTLFEKQDTLVAKITPCTENGKSAFIEDLDSDFGIATTEVITLTPTQIHPKYLYYYTESHPAKNYTVSRMRGTSGRQRVPKSVFERELKIPLPSAEEQERIASVLYTVDEMIARTSDLIDEYEQLKRGLMQDLLSGDVRTPDDLEVLEGVIEK